MEVIYILMLLIIIVLVISSKNKNNERLDRIEHQLNELNDLARQSVKAQAAEKFKPADPRPWEAKEASPAPPKPLPPVAPPPITPPKPEPVKVEREPQAITPPPVKRPEFRKPEPEPEPELSFFERYPDLEKFIGENLVNKIGIAILVLAIGFFVKYAIDNNWVGPVGRVGIGVLCGGILIGIAHRMRNSYKAFSSVLVGGGLAVLYFTITLAYHQFHLFNQTASFIILIVITIFAVLLSLLYNKQELAVIAFVGGLASPFMVSSGQANYNALFIYLVILNAGLLVIAYYKAWRVLNAVVFGLTVIVFGAVLTSLTAATYHTGLLYASILYLLFFGINVANNVKENKAFLGSDFSILLINTGLYFGVGLYLLTQMGQTDMRGLFTASLGVLNLLLSFVLFKNKKVDTNVLYLLIGITLTFISLTAPIQLNGHYITLFWAAETVLLYWLYRKSKITLMKLTSLLVWCAMLISLVMDWITLYYAPGIYNKAALLLLPIIANKGFITTVVAAISCYLLYLQIQRDDTPRLYGLAIPAMLYRNMAFILLFASGLLEVNHQFTTRYPDTSLNLLYLMLYIPAFVYVFYLLGKRLSAVCLRWEAGAGLMALAITVYFFSLPALFATIYEILAGHNISSGHLVAHWVSAIFVALLLYQLIKLLRAEMHEDLKATASWILSAAVVLLLSVELCLVADALFAGHGTAIDRVETVYRKVGLPILWGLSSFALMFLGMRNKARTLRIISLTLFAVTLGKLFIFDIKDIPPAGKIAAFFCLGVLLLIVSFMYQRVKKILVEDESKKNEE
ncbi:DUF2339 domain-containing protein [Mucilaginibacter psychrotolerans]|uniref:DUF2339 domain-containing protein n=1 Tax=Mucilaginibacter psychrotolerans TaxID=1524096 RepID=A0A4Y8SFC0_9SPHI|nr:DUF2339 domain-containing protein [Mucilaginibacter psychrotolerans]TFF37134.1 DUF2339 domain-containing protein [Mucilaginibacter psychrotolerans]